MSLPPSEPTHTSLSAGVGESLHGIAAEPCGPAAAELPAARVPAAHAAAARADPQQARPRPDAATSRRKRAARSSIARLVAIVAQLAGVPIQQVEPVCRTDPKTAGVVFEDGAHFVAGERSRPGRIVAKGLAARVRRAERITPASNVPAHTAPLRSSSTVATATAPRRPEVARACPCAGVQRSRPAFGADPERPDCPATRRTRGRCSSEPVAAVLATQMFEAARRRIENVDARVGRADPDPPPRIDEHCAQRVARQRLRVARVVAIGGERVGGAAPAGQAAVLRRDPQVVPRRLRRCPRRSSRAASFCRRGNARSAAADRRRSARGRLRCRSRRSPASPAGSTSPWTGAARPPS